MEEIIKHWENLSLNDIEGEVWVPIINYEDYMVSNMGRIKALCRAIKRQNGTVCTMKLRIMKPSINKGYRNVGLSNQRNKRIKREVHRIVGLHFIPNSNKKYTLNHIKGKEYGDAVSNLEWATQTEQIRHSRDVLNNLIGGGRKAVIKVGLNGDILDEYISISQAARENGLSKTCAARNAQGKRKLKKPFIFKIKTNE